MRRLLVAGIAALAVVLGLVVSMGVASAAPSQGLFGCTQVASPGAKCDNSARESLRPHSDHTCATGQYWNGTACVSAPATGDPVCTPPRVLNSAKTACVLTGGNNGGWGNNGDWGNHGHWIPGGNVPWGGPTLYGHQLWLNAQLGLDLCGYGNSYDTFLNRNLSHRSDIDRFLGRGRWQSLYSSDCNSSLAVVPNGLSLINGNLINLSLLGLQGAGTVDVCDYPSYDVFNSRFGSRFGNRWDNVRNRFGSNGFNVYRQLRVNAHCTTIVMPSSTTIVQAPQATLQAEAPAADSSGSEAAAAPAPLASGPLPAIAPAKAPNEGGFDLAYVLAHARVV